MSNYIMLNYQDVMDIKKNKKVIGQGVDGIVYYMGNGILYKLYHNFGDSIVIENKGIYDEDGVNIRDFKTLRNCIGFRNDNRLIHYVDGDGVILAKENAILSAINKQKNIKNTSLPQSIIKVDKKLAGCVYKYYPYTLSIYAISFLPLKYRLIIIERLLAKVKELLDNNIYPVTLAQKNDIHPCSKKDSNVLINYKLEPLLIDLDGISALYSDTYSNIGYKKAMTSLSTLILELLIKTDIHYEDMDNYIDDFIIDMKCLGIDEKYIDSYLEDFSLDLFEMNSLIKELKK